MTERVNVGKLSISTSLHALLEQEIAPDLNLDTTKFWQDFERIAEKYIPINKELLEKRKELQTKIDEWHLANKDFDFGAYKSFLKEIGYLVDEGPDFEISTANVDAEIAEIAGPQLVVPVMNARFSLNAANARWGSLYDALYGTDMISEDGGADRGGAYNPIRGDKVIDFSKNFLNDYLPLAEGKYQDVVSFQISNGSLEISLSDQSKTSLKNDSAFVGFKGDETNPESILLKNNDLHVEIKIDRNDSVGSTDPAGIKDVFLESAVTTIQDLEDSVAAVNGDDKADAYKNWLGLMKGNLAETFEKSGSTLTRSLNEDLSFFSPDGKTMQLSARSLMLVRNVGHLMTNPAILLDGKEIPEGIIDAMFTIAIGKHDIDQTGSVQNSRTGSIYIVKPKMHGPDEVQFTCDLFSDVENALGLEKNTAKVGIMDEERRTTVNLRECIRVAKERVIFINTGFLDRTGDEIHTSMEAGPMIRKAEMKQQPWILSYEDWNVDNGLASGFKGKAQIGKGMWPMPDMMLDMFNTKTMHPKAGANCAWVPSPTAATLHAMHYHQISVSSEQSDLLKRNRASLDDILTIPLLKDASLLSAEEIQAELDNNAQGILGYVVRWIDQGIGCSKVPDINNIGLMEDRATCRISSQHMANWLHHGLCSEEQVLETMKKMALVVDEQNAGDSEYVNMAPSFDGVAFKAACDLVIKGRIQPSGYTEPILHEKRQEFLSS
ncbi:MAG: malate synthase G [Gammaproteobacteria bacterium]|tara:strand:+ start:963 stop:3122 length:2160 start_codon:yes stop_codon:yes gene_type:complete